MALPPKAAYVVRQRATGNHECHWPGCTKQVPPAMWGCKEHWFKLPAALRARVWRAYRPGQEISKTPSREYVAVARDVQEWIADRWVATGTTMRSRVPMPMPDNPPRPMSADEMEYHKARCIVERWFLEMEATGFTEQDAASLARPIAEALRAAEARGIELAAQWHDKRYCETPDAFEMEFHDVSRKAIRSLPLDPPGGEK